MSQSERKLPSAPPASGLLPTDALGDPDAEEDSDAGDQALPHVDELPDPALVEAALSQDRARLKARLNDARLRAQIVRYLMVRHSMPEDPAEDVTQDAMKCASRARKWPAENVPLYPWLRRYANFQRLKYSSAAATRESREQADENIELHAHERAPEDERAPDVDRIASELAAESPQNAVALDMWRARAEGVPVAAVAAEAGIGEEAAKKRMQRFAAAVRARWAEMSATAAAVAGVLLLILHTLVPHPRPAPIGLDPERPLPVLPQPMQPQPMRREAKRLCYAPEKKAMQFVGCRAWLDRAKIVDPAGDAVPEVQAMRKRVGDALVILEKRNLPPDF